MNPYNNIATVFRLDKKKNGHPVNMDTKKIKLVMRNLPALKEGVG